MLTHKCALFWGHHTGSDTGWGAAWAGATAALLRGARRRGRGVAGAAVGHLLGPEVVPGPAGGWHTKPTHSPGPERTAVEWDPVECRRRRGIWRGMALLVI